MRVPTASRLVAYAIMLGIAPAGSALASDMRFSFSSPAFNGSPASTTYFLNQLEAQKPSFTTDSEAELTDLELFEDQLRRRILSAIASSIVSDIYALDLTTETEFEAGGLSILVKEDTSNENLVCFAISDGVSTTEVCVPSLG
ncbi:curli assembly protein CsgF [Pelagovum sp. HNIBRBA483]|uniref:curli assembly protein CsgF n=1 Tax=Pelagovum sp. HNIBRBA483 TaxID=3233341 RepID=UPI0034A2187B